MDMLKKIFPLSFKATELKPFIITLVIYIVADIICGAVIGLLAKIPVLGIIFGLLGSVVGIYMFVGLIFAILYFVKVIK